MDLRAELSLAILGRPSPDLQRVTRRMERLVQVALRRYRVINVRSAALKALLMSCFPAGDRCLVLRLLPQVLRGMVALGAARMVKGFHQCYGGSFREHGHATLLVHGAEPERRWITMVTYQHEVARLGLQTLRAPTGGRPVFLPGSTCEIRELPVEEV